jgi:pimeloyl-ACP methyl ester carboxylesterase
MLAPMDAPTRAVGAPPPDGAAEPAGYVVLLDDRDRVHFLDWGGPSDRVRDDGGPGVLLIHGLAATAWSWTPVARRIRAVRHVVAMDLRGHGLSDAPTEGYDEATLAEDVIAVAEGSGVLAMPVPADGPSDHPPGAARAPGDGRVLLAGHGFGAIVAAWAAAALGDRCAALVLVDGGWEALPDATGLEVDEFMRDLDEPPEVLRSMRAYLADRAAFDPGTWDADQEVAARAAVVELPVGRLELAIHDHVRAGSVAAMFEYRPVSTLVAVSAPITILAAADDEERTHARTLAATIEGLVEAGRPAPRVLRFPDAGHALMRYRPDEVVTAILAAGSEGSG